MDKNDPKFWVVLPAIQTTVLMGNNACIQGAYLYLLELWLFSILYS